MSALYVHIPFCKQACYYCDFHFSTNTELKTAMVNAICQEIRLQKSYLSTPKLQTIYFGGGTPSLLTELELNQILSTIHQHFTLLSNAEITLEANPDDIDPKQLKHWKEAGINRLSIGIQSFNDQNLTYLHRIHSAQAAKDCIKQAQEAGFEQLTVDLIYAIPTSSHTILQNDLDQLIALQIPHISAYCLTIEEKTVFGKWLKHKKIQPIDETLASEQFEIVITQLAEGGFIHYEISNFAQPNAFSQHNSNYWKNGQYLGVGAAAHSFNGSVRQYNIANNTRYIQQINQQIIPATIEILSPEEQINDYILTSLRTIWGCDLTHLKTHFGIDLYAKKHSYIDQYLSQGLVQWQNEALILQHKGKFVADKIAMDLFI